MKRRARWSAFSLASAPELQKKTRAERIGTPCGQPLGQLLALRQRHRGRIEEQRLRLLRYGANDVGMAMPGRGHGVTSVGIEPLVSVLVDQPRAVTANRSYRHLGIDGKRAEAFVSIRLPSAWIDPRAHETGALVEAEREIHRLYGLAHRRP